MKASELKSGYLVCHNDDIVRLYDNLEEAQEHIAYHKGSNDWNILYITVKNA
jgi:hypothetical protein